MTKRNRTTLKNFFRNGSVPSESQFEDLVDSTLNIIDEGFDKSPAEGLKVSQLTDAGKLISFFRDNLEGNPLYFIKVDRDENLVFGSDQPRNVLFRLEEAETDERLKVGINIEQPEMELDVGGVIRSEGRIGVAGRVDKEELRVNADGGWHNITGTLTGCHAFEVMAGAGGTKTEGRYSLMHAIALNAYNPTGLLFNFLNTKKRIKHHTVYYSSRKDKLRLRWLDEGNRNYRLQLKSNSTYGEGIQIRYYITRLWFDEEMNDSRFSKEGNGG